MSKSLVKVGIVQNACTIDVEANLAAALRGIQEAAAKGANIICLQELFMSVYFCQIEDHKYFELAEPIPGPTTEAMQAVAHAFSRLKQLAERMGVWEDAVFQDTYAKLRLDLEDLKSLYGVFVDKVRRGETLGPDVSMLKVFQTELFQRITDTMLEICGENAGLLDPMEGNRNLNPTGLYIQARPSTIYGGSNEIQRNIISKNVLALPG